MSSWLAEVQETERTDKPGELRLRCLRCACELAEITVNRGEGLPEAVRCSECGWEMRSENGIWDAMLPERAQHFQKFVADYEHVRQAEGRGSNDAEYYLALPYRDLSGRNRQQWEIRAKTWKYLELRLLPELRRELGRPLHVLDLGAGNGWMSYRLSLAGDRAVAVDLLVNEQDGLGAAKQYTARLASPFPRFQAELDRLPFADGQFDCAIFNASFHYSENYERTMKEAMRCIAPHGRVIVADTAWYRKAESGEQMVAEKQAAFRKKYGFTSNAIESREYLTDDRLRQLAVRLGIRWEAYKPWYGVRWAMRPWVARWKRRREPSQFRIYVGRVEA
ncbi:MAG: class I SAM-dependent methyltransferase [Candidatus Korobacteraceae bacterium]